MRKILCFVILFLCLSNIVFASELTSGEIAISGEEQANEISLKNELLGDEFYDGEYEFKTLKGTVIEIAKDVYEESNGYMTFKYQDVIVHIKDQGYNTKKLIKYSVSFYGDMKVTNPELKVGDKVYVYTTFEDGRMSDTEISYRNNTSNLVLIIIIYSVAIIVIGGLKGIKALISLILTVLAVFYIILPQIISGTDPLFITIVTCILITCVTLFIIAGFSKKAISAILGTSCGIIVAGLFAIIFGNKMVLSGVTEEARLLIGLVDTIQFDFKGILFSGIIIGALGACMDVGMSLASALSELKEESPNISFGKMLKSGMNIGRDMIGTMTNTLILAYTGGSIILIILFSQNNMQLFEVVNQEMMLEEILKAIAGSFGLITTIPFTALISSMLMCKKK